MTVKLSNPKVETRPAQPYLAIRLQAPHTQFPEVIPASIDDVFAYMQQQGIESDGPPLMRYHVIDMAGVMDVAIGWPVASAVLGAGRIIADTLPAGDYATLVYTGVENGIAGNGVLIDWAQAQGLQWDRWDDPKGDAFAGRVEFFLSGPEDDPDPANWDTEVAIKVKGA